MFQSVNKGYKYTLCRMIHDGADYLAAFLRLLGCVLIWLTGWMTDMLPSWLE